MTRIAIIGECMIELNGEPFGAMHQTFGGDTLNAAVYTRRSAGEAVDVYYVTALGSDQLSDGMIQRWQAENINTTLVLRDDQRSPGLYLIQVDARGERTFLYWRNQSAARYLIQHPEFPAVRDAMSEMDMVLVSGISLAILPDEDRSQLIEMLAELSQAGVKIAFDTNFRPALWPANEEWKTVKDVYAQLFPHCDLALVTYDDEQLVWGDNNAQETVNRLKLAGVRNIIVKLGADGCLAQKENGEATMVPTTPVSQVVDTTSAGDSFNGGFLSAWLRGHTIEQSCQRGHSLAGIVIQHRGAIVPRQATDALPPLEKN